MTCDDSRKWGLLVVAVVVCAIYANTVVAATRGKVERYRAAKAAVTQQGEIEVLIAAKEGEERAAQEMIVKNGGYVLAGDTTLGWWHARVPLAAAPLLAESTVVEALDRSAHLLEPRATVVTPKPQLRLPQRWYDAARLSTGVEATGIPELWVRHPTFDGRGVLVTVGDAIPDFGHPTLQLARDARGVAARKFVEIRPAAIGRSARTGWLMCQVCDDRASISTVALAGRSYRKPRVGTFLCAILDEDTPMDGFHGHSGDLNRDGNPRGSSSLFGVCWDPAQDLVWVDSNQNLDFGDDSPLHSFSRSGEIGEFGPELPFVAETDSGARAVWLGFGAGEHGTMQASALAGSDYPGLPLSSPAPAAQLIAYGLNTNPSAFLDMAMQFRSHPRSEILQLACIVGDTSWQFAGPTVPQIVLDRLQKRTGKIVVNAFGNDLGSSLGRGIYSGEKALMVGAYMSRGIWQAHFGMAVEHDDYVAPISARGPAANGALAPTVIAPTNVVTASPRGHGRDSDLLPDGIRIGGGTSTASPVAGGVVASLLSGAKQAGLPYEGERLKRAIIMGARWLDGWPAHEQGNGLIRAPGAWESLQRLAKKELIEIDVRGSVHTVQSQGFPVPNEGPGLYEREGWRVGTRSTRTLRFRRLNGPSTPQRYSLRWKGNDGTFRTVRRITLPLGEVTELPISIEPKGPGVHSAILDVLDNDGDLVHQLMTVIVAAEEFDADGRFVRSGTIERPSRRSFFFRVPTEVQALDVVFNARRGDLRWTLIDPRARASHPDELIDFTPHRAVLRPHPGVWELSVSHEQDALRLDPFRPNKLEPGAFSFTVALKKIEGTASHRDRVQVRNLFFGGLQQAIGLPLAAKLDGESRVTPDSAAHFVAFEVPVGTERLVVRGRAPEGDCDLYLFHLSDATTINRSFRADQYGAAEDSIAVENPSSGVYRLAIDPYRAPASGTTVKWSVALFHPNYGRVIINDELRVRAKDDYWTVPYHISAAIEPPPTGFKPAAYLAVVEEGVDSVEYKVDASEGTAWWDARDKQRIATPLLLGWIELPLPPTGLGSAQMP